MPAMAPAHPTAVYALATDTRIQQVAQEDVMMSYNLRAPMEDDWPDILAAADAAVPWAGEENQRWLANRRAYAARGLPQRHYVAEDQNTRQVMGYGAVEGVKTLGLFRVFVVMSSALLTGKLGQLMYDKLLADLGDLRADKAFAYEWEQDRDILAFFAARGFSEVRRDVQPDGNVYIGVERVFNRKERHHDAC